MTKHKKELLTILTALSMTTEASALLFQNENNTLKEKIDSSKIKLQGIQESPLKIAYGNEVYDGPRKTGSFKDWNDWKNFKDWNDFRNSIF
ncbi:MAG: hypothetical protein WC680_10255 [Sulfuricurvum sp.]|jgi:hypothetical protein